MQSRNVYPPGIRLDVHPPGQERFGNMTRVYYKEAVGAFIVFDVTRVSTFEAVQKWKHDIDSKVHSARCRRVRRPLFSRSATASRYLARATDYIPTRVHALPSGAPSERGEGSGGAARK